MPNENNREDNGQKEESSSDWSHPDSKPPHEPDDSQAPGPQGARAPQGGEWGAGYAHEPDPEHERPGEHAWAEGPGHPEPGEEDQLPVERSPTAPTKPDNDDILAVVLSMFLPGIGQITQGQTTKGFVVFLLAIPTLCGLGLYNLAAAFDTYCVAMAKKRRTVGDWEFFPDAGEVFGAAKKKIGES